MLTKTIQNSNPTTEPQWTGNLNTVVNGDCRNILCNISDESIAACITDPPYNYEFVGHKWDHKEIERRISKTEGSSTLVRNLPYGSGLAGGVRNKNWYAKNRNNILEYSEWCSSWAKELFRVCKPGAFVAVFNSTRTAAHAQVALETEGFYARDIIVYRRSSGIPKGLNLSAQLKKKGRSDWQAWQDWHSALRGEWEAIVLVQKPLIDNYLKTFEKHGVGLMKAINPDGSFQSNILEGFSERKTEKFNVHCTVKPLPLMEKLVDMLVPTGDENVILDPFAGSGTTLVAAKKLGRSYVGIEIVPDYISIIDKRLGHAVNGAISETHQLADEDTQQRQNLCP